VISKRILEARWYFLWGGLIFWVPDVLLHWSRGDRFSGRDALVLTLLLPLITCSVLVLIWRRLEDRESRAPEAFAVVLGVWMLGPAMMYLGWIPGANAHPGDFRFILLYTVIFPFTTFVMSTYDGTLFAVLITTALLPLLAISRLSRGRPSSCA
jgi:hypothetical protein